MFPLKISLATYTTRGLFSHGDELKVEVWGNGLTQELTQLVHYQ